MARTGHRIRGYTLLEIVLVVGILAVLAATAIPNLIGDIESRRLPESARRMRSLLTLVRANAMYDGKRYRVRFPAADELDTEGEARLPLVEREDDPFGEPEAYNRVTEPWARGDSFLREVWCAEVRLGRPTIEKLQQRLMDQETKERMEAQEEDFEENYPPIYFESDGTSEWATFVLTNAPKDTDLEQLDDYPRVEVIMDGLTGLIWLQRPFYEDELELFREHDWPPVLRKDFLRTAELTEMDVLEIQETAVRR